MGTFPATFRCARSFRCQAASHGLLKQVSQRIGIKGFVQYSQIRRGRSHRCTPWSGHLQLWIARPDLTREADPVDRPGHDDVAKLSLLFAFRQTSAPLQPRTSQSPASWPRCSEQRRCYLRNLDTVVNNEDHRTLRMRRRGPAKSLPAQGPCRYSGAKKR